MFNFILGLVKMLKGGIVNKVVQLLSSLKQTSKSPDSDKIYFIYDNENPEALEQTGVMYFQGHQCKFISGKWGRGFAPRGKWRAIDYHDMDQKHELWKGYSLYNMAFYVNLQLISLAENCNDIEKKRSIDMTGIQIHFDGGVRGTLGCFGLIPDNEDHAVRMRNLLRNYFENHKFIDVEVM